MIDHDSDGVIAKYLATGREPHHAPLGEVFARNHTDPIVWSSPPCRHYHAQVGPWFTFEVFGPPGPDGDSELVSLPFTLAPRTALYVKRETGRVVSEHAAQSLTLAVLRAHACANTIPMHLSPVPDIVAARWLEAGIPGVV